MGQSNSIEKLWEFGFAQSVNTKSLLEHMTQTSKKNCVKIEIKADIPPEIATKIFQAIESSMDPEISFTNKDEVTEISFSGPHLLIKFFSQDIVTLRIYIVNSNMRLIYASFRSLTD